MPVGIAALQWGSSTDRVRVFRLWSDGAIDMTFTRYQADPQCLIVEQCGPALMIPGSCMADVDRNGNVEFPDLLNVLSDWGPCK